MKLKQAKICNFRRLEAVSLQFENTETVFVGANNSGKTSATSAFRCFFRKRPFKIHDFSLSSLSDIDKFDFEAFDKENPDTHLPSISLDIWFSLDPGTAEYGRVAPLLSDLNEDVAEIGIGCVFSVNDHADVWREYTGQFPADEGGKRQKSFSEFLGLEGNLGRYYSIRYAALKRTVEDVERILLPPAEGRKTLHSLLRLDFVDAQRQVQDDEETSRGSKLSTAFGAFYNANLQQAESGNDAIRIVEEHNTRLTEHYKVAFEDIFKVIGKLGVSAAHERHLEIKSTLGAEEALRGTTDLFYTDKGGERSLPEAYNGLGFKNLILMAIQMRDYQLQWANTEAERPLCHIIFVEEPEVHLHAQVQQTFVENMWAILDELAEQEGVTPQLVITTHSSHILNSVDFEKVRYFRRCRRPDESPDEQPLLTISEVSNLREFQVSEGGPVGEDFSAAEALNFLKKYLTLTHCDLMFADAAILIEGTAERLLLPAMIKRVQPRLSQAYLTTLEVGGAYAHVFADLMAFLHIPYLVITDIDSVKPNPDSKRMKACCATDEQAVTSNGALKAFFSGTETISDFCSLDPAEQIQASGDRFVTFQRAITVNRNGDEVVLHGRTLEEAFIYENIDACYDDGLLSDLEIPEAANEINEAAFKLVQGSTFKKTEFALRILSADEWVVPSYISEGLEWLAARLGVEVEEDGH